MRLITSQQTDNTISIAQRYMTKVTLLQPKQNSIDNTNALPQEADLGIQTHKRKQKKLINE